MEQRGTAKALAADALAALEVVIRGFEHGRGYLLKLESSDAMPELAQIGAQAGCGALLNLAGCNAGVDVVGGVLVERPRGPTHEVAMVELDDGAVAVTFRHAAHRPSAAGEGVYGAQ